MPYVGVNDTVINDVTLLPFTDNTSPIPELFTRATCKVPSVRQSTSLSLWYPQIEKVVTLPFTSM